MKKIIAIIALLSAVALNGQTQTVSALTARAQETRAAYEEAIKGLRGNAMISAAEKFDSENIATYSALVASISLLPASEQSWVAIRNARALNGIRTNSWEKGVGTVKAYAYPQYIAYAGTLAEAQAYASQPDANAQWVFRASIRLENAALWTDFCVSRLGTGETEVHYQAWFKRYISKLSNSAQLEAIQAEIDALWMDKSQSAARDKWLVELRSGKILKGE